jgi:hypothetical protein
VDRGGRECGTQKEVALCVSQHCVVDDGDDGDKWCDIAYGRLIKEGI